MKSVLYLIALGILTSWLATQAGLGLLVTALVTMLSMLLGIGFALAAVQEFSVPNVNE